MIRRELNVATGEIAEIEIEPAVQSGLTPEEISAQRITAIDARLTSLDLASIRALTAKVLDTTTEEDLARLAEIEAEKAILRSERSLINV